MECYYALSSPKKENKRKEYINREKVSDYHHNK